MPRRSTALLAVLCLGLFVISLDDTILNVALPALAADLGADARDLQWTVDAYLLVFCALVLTAGALGDRFGRRRSFAAGLVLFGASSVAAAFCTSPEALIAVRASMGVGAALIMPSTLSLITAVFTGAERTRAIAAWTAIAGLGVAAGPLAGGFLVEHASWRWVFLVNVPIVIVALVGCATLVPESRDPGARRLDLPGLALSGTALGAIVWALIEAPVRGWTDAVVLGALAAGLLLLGAFAAWERRAAEPMLDLALLRDRRFTAGSATIAAAFFGLFGVLLLMTQYLQVVLGHSPLEAGAWTAMLAAGMVAGAPLATLLEARAGTRAAAATGACSLSATLALLSLAGTGTGFAALGPLFFATGVALALVMAPATAALMSAVPESRLGIGSATNDAVRIVGGTIGVAVLGSLASSGYRGHMEDAVAGLPAPAAEAARDGVAGAAAVADRLGPAGDTLRTAADAAFVGGLRTALIAGAAVALAGALTALALPGRAARAAAPVGAPAQGAAAA
jgi:EmrB/QacA subfamily drug resistance transporter